MVTIEIGVRSNLGQRRQAKRAYSLKVQQSGLLVRLAFKQVMLLLIAPLCRGWWGNGDDVTPVGLNSLPFGPQDVLGLGFYFEADYVEPDSGIEIGKKIHAWNETFLLDDKNCTFYTRFRNHQAQHPYNDWSSTCGSTIRLTPSQLASLGLSNVDVSRSKLLVTEHTSHATSYWDYDTGGAWLDQACIQSPGSLTTHSMPIDLLSAGSFSLRFMWDKPELMNNNNFYCRLKQTRVQTINNDGIVQYNFLSTFFKNKAKDVGRVMIRLFKDQSTFAAPDGLQFIGTQADYENTHTDVRQFGIYYRTRQCSQGKIGNYTLCTGQQVANYLLNQQYYTPKWYILGLDGFRNTLRVPIDRLALLNELNCLSFYPTITLSIPNTPVWLAVTNIDFEFMDTFAHLHITMVFDHVNMPYCAEAMISAEIQPFAFPNAQYDFTMPEFYRLRFVQDCNPTGIVYSSFDLDLFEHHGKSYTPLVTLQLNAVVSNGTITKQLTYGGENVSFQARLNGDLLLQLAHECCIEWKISSIDSLLRHVEPVIQSGKLTALKFHNVKELKPGKFTLKLKAISLAQKHFQNGSGWYTPETNEVSIAVEIAHFAQSTCDALEYGFTKGLPDIDINLDSTLIKINLPEGLDFQYLEKDRLKVDDRECLIKNNPAPVWSVWTTSEKVSISFEAQPNPPSKLLMTWIASQIDQIPRQEEIQIQIDLIDPTTSKRLHSLSFTVTLKCSFEDQPSITCPSGFFVFNLDRRNEIGGLSTNHRVPACNNSVKYSCLQSNLRPILVKYDLCKSSIFTGTKLITPSISASDLALFNNEKEAEYKIRITVALGETKQSCPILVLVKVDDTEERSFFSMLQKDEFGETETIKILIDSESSQFEFDLGELIYHGYPADTIEVSIDMRDGATKFVSIIQTGKSYKLAFNFLSSQPQIGVVQDIQVSLSITLVKTGKKVTQTINMKCIFIEDDFDAQKVQLEQHGPINEQKSETDQTQDVIETIKGQLEIPKDIRIRLSSNEPLIVPPLTAEQSRILSKPLVELTENEVFYPIPILARLTNGLEYVEELVRRQTQLLTKEAAEADSDSMPAEIRAKMDNFRKVHIRFTQEMNLPADALDLLNGTEEVPENEIEQGDTSGSTGGRLLAKRRSKAKKRVECVGLKDEDFDEEDLDHSIMDGWEIKSVDKNGMVLLTKMNDPMQASQGSEPDFLLIQIELGEAETENGEPMKQSILKKVMIARQMMDEDELDAIDGAGGSGKNIMTYSCFQHYFLDVIYRKPMNHLWDVINSLQMVEYSKLFKTQTPGNVAHFSTYFDDVTDFDLLPNQDIINGVLYVPEKVPFSLNFSNAGYDSNLFLINNAPYFVNIIFVAIFLSLLALTYRCAILHEKTKVWHRNIRAQIFWNANIRIYAETYLQCFLFALLNLYEISWQYGIFSIVLSNMMSYIVLVAGIFLPIFFCSLYLKSRAKWDDQEFQDTAGSLLEGTRIHKSLHGYSVLTFIFTFFLRRVLLALSLVYWQDFLWGQVACQFVILTSMLILIQWFNPKDSRYSMWVETFNEVVGLNVTIMLMTFSSWQSNAERRRETGFAWISVVGFYCLVHLLPMLKKDLWVIKHSFRKFYYKLKYKWYQRKNKRITKKDQSMQTDPVKDIMIIDRNCQEQSLQSMGNESALPDASEVASLYVPHASRNHRTRSTMLEPREQLSSGLIGLDKDWVLEGQVQPLQSCDLLISSRSDIRQKAEIMVQESGQSTERKAVVEETTSKKKEERQCIEQEIKDIYGTNQSFLKSPRSLDKSADLLIEAVMECPVHDKTLK